MARVILVRHGHAEATWGQHPDPGLSMLGRSQSEAAAAVLARLGPVPVVSSPLRRCRETAEPLVRRWGVEASVDPAVGEVAAPPGVDVGGRAAWLAEAMAGSWSSLPSAVRDWRDGVVRAVLRVAEQGDAVVFSHFVAINAVIGRAVGDDRVCVCRPDNCSRTVVDVVAGRLVVVELGGEAATHIG